MNLIKVLLMLSTGILLYLAVCFAIPACLVVYSERGVFDATWFYQKIRTASWLTRFWWLGLRWRCWCLAWVMLWPRIGRRIRAPRAANRMLLPERAHPIFSCAGSTLLWHIAGIRPPSEAGCGKEIRDTGRQKTWTKS